MDENDESVSSLLALVDFTSKLTLQFQSHATPQSLLSPLPPTECRSGTFRDRRTHRRCKFETHGTRQTAGRDHSERRESSHFLGFHDDVEHLGGLHAATKLQV